MSNHHHKQFPEHNSHEYPGAGQPGFPGYQPAVDERIPANGDYYSYQPVQYENLSPTQTTFSGFSPEVTPFDSNHGTPNSNMGGFSYLQPNYSNTSAASGYFFSSAASSPRQEHTRTSVSSLPSSLPSPYAKDGPDVLAAMRMRQRPRSFAQSRGRQQRALSSDMQSQKHWQLPYTPRYSTGTGVISPTSEFPYGQFPPEQAHMYVGEQYDFVDPVEHRFPPPLPDEPIQFYQNHQQQQQQQQPELPPLADTTQQPQVKLENPSQQQDRSDLSQAASPLSEEAYSPTYTREDESFDERSGKKSATCPVCNKLLKRDLTRHMRTHEQTARFICPFPRKRCPHKRGQFNRPYDFKKHLLHHHFQFDKAKVVRKFRDLQSKLSCRGSCPCGQGNFLASEWLEDHILGGINVCPLVNPSASMPLEGELAEGSPEF